MRHSLVSLNDRNKNIVAFSSFSPDETNKDDIFNMKRILSQAVNFELTPRQRQCVVLYYYDNMKMKEIADMLSLSPSTVTRHIKAALCKLQSIAKYYK